MLNRFSAKEYASLKQNGSGAAATPCDFALRTVLAGVLGMAASGCDFPKPKENAPQSKQMIVAPEHVESFRLALDTFLSANPHARDDVQRLLRPEGPEDTLTANQVDFLKHLEDNKMGIVALRLKRAAGIRQ